MRLRAGNNAHLSPGHSPANSLFSVGVLEQEFDKVEEAAMKEAFEANIGHAEADGLEANCDQILEAESITQVAAPAHEDDLLEGGTQGFFMNTCKQK
jgi:hypothetical protein